MNNIKVKAKLSIVMLAAFIALTICVIFSTESMDQLEANALDTMETTQRESYDQQINEQVDNVISLCQMLYDAYEAGDFSEEQAKSLAADQIRALRYGDNGYFWVD